MRGEDVKRILNKNKFPLNEIAEKMNETPQNLQSLLKSVDIKTGVLERIGKAINKNLYFFMEEQNGFMLKSAPESECPHCKELKEENARLIQRLNDQLVINQNVMLNKLGLDETGKSRAG